MKENALTGGDFGNYVLVKPRGQQMS